MLHIASPNLTVFDFSFNVLNNESNPFPLIFSSGGSNGEFVNEIADNILNNESYPYHSYFTNI